MAENLNVGEMVDGNKDQNDDSKIERYCYDNDTMKCEEYGGLYQWAEMMKLPSECNAKSCADSIKPNHQGICPDGWRLMTYNDFYIVVHADGNDAGVEGVRSTGFGGLNYTGYSLIGAGMRLDDDGVSSFIDINEAAYWFFPTEKENKTTWAGVAFTIKSIQNFDNGYGPKIDGYPVRCVKID